MRLTHGSEHSTAAEQGFDLLDYKQKFWGEATGDVNNGKDAEGPGIYVFIDNEETGGLKGAIENASIYSGDKGVIYVLSVDVDEEDLLNNRSASEIDAEDWAKVIENFMSKQRAKAGYDVDEIYSAVQPVVDSIDSGESIAPKVLKDLEDRYEGLRFDNVPPNEYDDGYQWQDEVVDEYIINNDPVSHINDNGGSKGIAEYAVNSSDNQWETLKTVWNSIAISNTGAGIETFNKTFKDSTLEVLGDDYDLTAAKVVNDAFMVVFDTDEIQIKKVINENKDLECESELSP